ncbi:SMP-30/gluconolactonase/LRE family protein [Achromobacter aegrifaciens]
MDEITILDARLEPVVRGARLEQLCSGAIWSEGPVWIEEDDSVLWSDIPNNRILRWSQRDGMTVWREGAEFTNGHARDLNGDLLHCSHGLRAIVRTPAGAAGLDASSVDEIVVDRHEGRRLNSPNDLVVRSDGTIWFTDPPYGIMSDREGHKAPSEQRANHVFCYDPMVGRLHAATAVVEEPNGLAFSPDESVLYVSDTSAALRADGGGNRRIVAFDVSGVSLSNFRVVVDVVPGLPDGLRLDNQGWLYTSSADSVQILLPDGTCLGRIAVPEKVGNLTFGGKLRNQLYIAASTSLYRITLNTQGVQRP